MLFVSITRSLECTEDFNPLNGIDAQVCFEIERRLQHLHRVAGTLADDRAQTITDRESFRTIRLACNHRLHGGRIFILLFVRCHGAGCVG